MIKEVVGKAEAIRMVVPKVPLKGEGEDLRLWIDQHPLTLEVSTPSRLINYTKGLTEKNVRKPLKTPPISPDNTSWDNPFPTFPGAKKKSSLQEEQTIIQKMDGMNIQHTPTQNRPRTAGSKGSQDRYPNGGRGPPVDDYGRPSMDSQRRGPPPEDYGRPSGESQRMPPRGYPPQGVPQQQDYQDPRRGPPPGQGNGYGGPPPRHNGYGDSGYDDRGGYGPRPTSPMYENFGPPARSMTLPNEQPMGRQTPMAGPMDGPGPSAPYNGPVGRQMPARPSTATGARPPPQRTYPPVQQPVQHPVQQPPQQQYNDPYDNGNYSNGHNPNESISEFYDSYYNEPDPRQSRPLSNGSEMPNFDAIPVAPASHKRGNSIDEHILAPVPQPTGYQQVKPVKSQPDFRARAQPQAAVFEMANDAPPMPNAYPPQQGGYDDGYGAPNGQYNQPPPGNQRPPPQGYGGYSEPPPAQQGFQPPPRSTSAAPRTGVGLPNNPRPGLSGPPPNGPLPQPGKLPRTNTAPSQQKALSEDALPSHPVPVRPGLMPNSIAAQSLNNKPAPVRNYNNVGPAGVPVQPTPAPAPAPAQPPAPATAAAQIDTNQPVTIAELERLRKITQDNPNDQKTAMVLVKRLVEASEVLVPSIPDQRARNKTREKYVMDANKILKKLVAATNPDAMFYLADCYGRGSLGLEADPKEAFVLYQHAAKIGHPAAAYRTAVCCELGNDDGGGTRKDPLKAMQWYKRSAMLGDAPAMYKMGMIQLKGLLGQQRNPREAIGWLKRAAERADAENPHALHELGLLYEQQQGNDSSVVRDESYSFKLFHQAAALGYKFSQFRLGTAYEYGLFNCAIDPRQSIMWYSRAAVQEEHQSELALSGWYLTGSEGVLQQSDTEAYLWARKAAMAGLAKAEYAMGYFTEVGIGAPANLEDAKRWYLRAAGEFISLSTTINLRLFLWDESQLGKS